MAGPTLVRDGRLALMPSEEGITVPTILGETSRSGVGITKENRLIFANCQSKLPISKWAEIMMALGCVSAVNLDGGTAMCLYYRGKTIVSPASKLTNVLV
ncbi:MAG: phosphodiester glycosidase family protein, partial [Armatimonadota bacterium]